VVFVFFVLDIPNYKNSDLANMVPVPDSPQSELASQPASDGVIEPVALAKKPPVVSQPPNSTTQPNSAVLTVPDNASSSELSASNWFIQVGAYESEVNANVERLKYKKSEIPSLLEKGSDGLTRILLGPYQSEAEAAKAQNEIPKELKRNDILVRQYTPHGKANTATAKTASIKGNDQVDSLNTLISEITPSQPNDITESSSDSNTASGWYIQVGAFKNQANAELHRVKFEVLKYPTYIESGRDEFRRVLVGPFNTETKADEIKGKIISEQNIKDLLVRSIKP